MRKDFRYFISPNEIQEEILCYSDGMGFEENPNFRIERTGFNNYLIMYTISGKLWCCQNEQEIAVCPGESILLDLHKYHKYYVEKGTPTRIAWLHLNGSPVTLLMKYLEQSSTLPIKMSDPQIYPQILAFFEVSDQAEPDIYVQSEQCYSLLLRFLEKNNQQRSPVEDSKQKEFKQIVWHVISHNLHRDITIEELAGSVSLSKYHFIRKFHSAFGTSPRQFIIREKIRQAKYQLIYTQDSVLQISESLGFTTQSYFSKVFKQASGFSPLDYRKMGLSGNMNHVPSSR